MANIEKFIVNGKTYQVQKLGVFDTLRLHLNTSHCLGGVFGQISDLLIEIKKNKDVDFSEVGKIFQTIDPDKIIEIQKTTFAQVITPENDFLNDELSIESWFSRPENINDVWDVFVKALFVLLGEHLPNFAKGLFKKEQETPALKSQSNT